MHSTIHSLIAYFLSLSLFACKSSDSRSSQVSVDSAYPGLEFLNGGRRYDARAAEVVLDALAWNQASQKIEVQGTIENPPDQRSPLKFSFPVLIFFDLENPPFEECVSPQSSCQGTLVKAVDNSGDILLRVSALDESAGLRAKTLRSHYYFLKFDKQGMVDFKYAMPNGIRLEPIYVFHKSWTSKDAIPESNPHVLFKIVFEGTWQPTKADPSKYKSR